MKYFTNCKTLEELRKEYKKFLKQYHPDQPEGSEEATKEINVEYEILFAILKNNQKKNDAAKTADNFNEEFDRRFREALKAIIDLNINIEIIGSWIWVSGETFAVKETLKGNGYRWIHSRKMWAFHCEPFIKNTKKQKSMEELRKIYGSDIVKEKSCYMGITA